MHKALLLLACALICWNFPTGSLPVIRAFQTDNPPMRKLRRVSLEGAVGTRSRKLVAERTSNRGDYHGDIPCRVASLVAADMPVPCVNIPFTYLDHRRRAGRVVHFVESKLALCDGDKHRAGVCMPSRRRSGGVIVNSHYLSGCIVA
jgi:hypothetical protein